MKKNSIMVNKMFRNILTAGTIAVAMTFGFTACSDEMEDEGAPANNASEQAGDYSQYEPYGLTYQNFVTENDVQILNADTTQIAVSKKLADKLGITSFVNHPLGIWQGIDQLPYARKAKEERLEGDMYILTVAPATLAELIGDKAAQLNTSIYVDNNAQAVQTRAADNNIPEFAAKYMDNDNIIHPAVIHMTDPYGYDKPYHGVDDPMDAAQTRAAESGHYQYMTAEELASGKTRFSINPNVLSLNHTVNIYYRFEKEKGSADTITISGKCPIDFKLNYFLTLNSEVKWKWCIPYPSLQKFESGFDGKLDFSPEAYIGFSKRVDLIDSDNQRKKLLGFGTYSFTFMVGIVPVNIQISPGLFMKFKANVEGGVRVGFKYQYKNEFKIGVKYENDKWSGIKDFKEVKNSFDFVLPEGYFTANAGMSFYLGMDVMLYGVAGPEMGIGPSLNADATLKIHSEKFLKPEEMFEFKGKVKMSIDAFVGAKVELLGYKLGNWSTTLPIAGPWILKQYPSDGTEHKSPEEKKAEDNRSIVQQVIDHIYGTDSILKRGCETAIFQLMQMNNVDRKQALVQYQDLVLKYDQTKNINPKDAKSLAGAIKTVSYTNQYIDGDYAHFCEVKYWADLDELIHNSQIYQLYNSKLGYWDKAIKLGVLYQQFMKKYNRKPEMNQQDMEILMKMLVNFSKEFYLSMERILKPHYNHLNAYANRTATGVSQELKEHAIYETIKYYTWKVRGVKFNESDKPAIEKDFNTILKKLQEIEKIRQAQ